MAMSFAEECDEVWEQAIKPAIEDDLESPNDYQAKRVDAATISSSIHSDILDGIAHSTLTFFDYP